MSSLRIDFNLLDLISTNMIKRGTSLSVAESCTGGFLSTFFTAKSGSSNFFNGSVISYSNKSKTNFLDVTNEEINHYGVVSKFVVEKMAKNVMKKFGTNYGLATTGYVELDSTNLAINNCYLHSWICIASETSIISKSITFNKTRLENISTVSYELLNLFVKEIV